MSNEGEMGLKTVRYNLKSLLKTRRTPHNVTFQINSNPRKQNGKLRPEKGFILLFSLLM
jgi:hypothetical protein